MLYLDSFCASISKMCSKVSEKPKRVIFWVRKCSKNFPYKLVTVASSLYAFLANEGSIGMLCKFWIMGKPVLYLFMSFTQITHTHIHTHTRFCFCIFAYLRSFWFLGEGQPECTVSMSGPGSLRDVPQLRGESDGLWEQEKPLNLLQVSSCLHC